MCFNGLKMGEWRLIAIWCGVCCNKKHMVASVRFIFLEGLPLETWSSEVIGTRCSTIRCMETIRIRSDDKIPSFRQIIWSECAWSIFSGVFPRLHRFGFGFTPFLLNFWATLHFKRISKNKIERPSVRVRGITLRTQTLQRSWLKARGWAMRQIEMIRSDCALTALASRQTLRWSRR